MGGETNEPTTEPSITISFVGTGVNAGNVSYSEVMTSTLGLVTRPVSLGFFDVKEWDGSSSDVVYLFGPDINAITLVSDPMLPVVAGVPPLGTLATEDVDFGASATMVIPLTTNFGTSLGQNLTLLFGFDGELQFPFETVADASDFIVVITNDFITAAGPPSVSVVEPPSLGLLGLAALTCLLPSIRKRIKRIRVCAPVTGAQARLDGRV
jgi:hypothetical protein